MKWMLIFFVFSSCYGSMKGNKLNSLNNTPSECILISNQFTHADLIDSLQLDRIVSLGGIIKSKKEIHNTYSEMVDTILIVKLSDSEFIFVKDSSRVMLIDCNIKDYGLTIGGFLQIGLTKKKMLDVIDGLSFNQFKNCSKLTIWNEETEAFTEIYFKKNKIVEMNTNWYYD